MTGRRQWLRALPAAAVIGVLVAIAGCGNDVPDAGLRHPELLGARVSWGEPSGGNPRGVVMLIHGGAWQPSESGYAEQRANAKVVQGWGYATVAIGYDAGAKGFRQIVAVYREARRRYPGLPICASGISAGANLALMLATREPDLDCVVSLSGPTDLTSLAMQDPKGDEAYRAAVEAFGKGRLAEFSPVRHANRIKAQVLLIDAESDPVVPAEQGRELAAALPGAQLLVVPPGPVPVEWAHFGGVQQDAQALVIKREFDFLKEVTAANR